MLQLRLDWKLAKMDCHDVWFLRDDRNALFTAYVGKAQQGNPGDHLQFVKDFIEENGEAGMWGGGVDASNANIIHDTSSIHERALRVEFKPEYTAILENCPANGELLITPFPNAGESGRYVFSLVGTVCNSNVDTDRIQIFDSLHFPER